MTEKEDPKDEGLVNVFDDFLLKERLALKLPCDKDELADPCGSAQFPPGLLALLTSQQSLLPRNLPTGYFR